MALQLIHTHTLSRCRLEMTEGIEIISRFQLLKQLLTVEFQDDPYLPLMLAEPVKNIDQDRINWYTELPGEVTPFESLSEEQRQQARRAVAVNVEKMGAFADRLMASTGSSNRVLAGELLRGILSRAAHYDIYLADGHPVVAGWGLSLDQEPRPNLDPQASPDSPPFPGGAKTGGDGLNAAGPSPPPPGAPAKFPPWLAGLLLGLLLLWLLLHIFWPGFWGLARGGFRPPEVTVDLDAFDLNVDRQERLRLELERLKEEYARRSDSCRPDLPELTEPVPKAEEDLVIPEDAASKNDFSFMEGCWSSETESLINVSTRQPVIYIYCFDESGEASVLIEEKDSKGRHIDNCRTTARAAFVGENLVITERDGARCGKGGQYYTTKVTCRPGEGGAAECDLEQDSGTVAKSTFRRAASQ